MQKLVCSWRPFARVMALALIAAAVPLPALAGDPPQSQAVSNTGIRASIQKIVQAQPVAPARSQAASAPSGRSVDLDSPSFFKTPAGIVVIAVLAAGAGYAVYSTSHDRINSPGR